MSPRPSLPDAHANPFLPSILTGDSLPPVKYQILNCQGQDILVGRLKILTNTGSGHAFILRRFDTSAVSVTTMFRAAFPNASEMEEKTEINWIKEHYDLSGNNGTLRDQHIARLAGVWVSPNVALELGADYKLGALINVVIDALPDPAQNYRRSGKAAAGSATNSPQVAAPAASPAQPQDQPAVKRRKESSPVPAPTQLVQPRRSTRTKSPAPRATVQQFSTVVVPRTPKAFKTAAVLAARRMEVAAMTSGGSEETVVEHEEIRSDVEKVIDHVAGDELREQDISEQKELIKRLKAQREAQKAVVVEETEEEGEEKVHEQEQGEEQHFTNGKRAREDEGAPLQFNFREPEDAETEERQIATNGRVEKWRGTKRVAWGVAAFAAGLGAVLLPTFF
ncbi:hypothetical protein AX14_011965 [Amanita brunnescens Koide BX004]|nr:hypothetical protein AX14_011965 [Amanita brunnescens Koide BX004]